MTTQDSYSPYAYPPEWYAEVAKLNIYQRLHGAMSDAKPVAKTAKDGIKFKFHGHEAVSAMVKALAEKWRIVVESSVVEHRFEVMEIYGKPRMMCILTVRVRWINIDKPEEYSEVQAVGYGVDESDKGPGKALSYALKMAQLKALLIHDGEKLDNEEFCYQHEREAAQLAAAKQEWAKMVKKLGYKLADEGERMKQEYGPSPSLEAILLDTDDMKAVYAKQEAKKQKATNKVPNTTEEEAAVDEMIDEAVMTSRVDDPERQAALALFPDPDPKPTFVDRG